jgi:hypothetical protein
VGPDLWPWVAWLQTGSFRVLKLNIRPLVIAHGILMAAAFVLLMPLGLLLARHR